jgi:uncharacterized membrane protein YgdD (TMEM256/DUF423 family)
VTFHYRRKTEQTICNYRTNAEYRKGGRLLFWTRISFAMTPAAPAAPRRFLIVGAVSAGIAVVAGAFGAHALRTRVEPRLLEVFETGARYQMYHALALIAVAWLLERIPGSPAPDSPARRPAMIAGWSFILGTVLFAGSLYLMTFTGIRAFGAVTPLGGVAFLIGWASLALAAMRAP